MTSHTALVPYDGSEAADKLLYLACRTMGSDGRVIALALTEVHPTLPLMDLPVHFDEPARRALVRAEGLARLWGSQIEPRLRRTHDAARTIVREARIIPADAVFLALKPRRFSWLPTRLGRTARMVLHEVSCPVILGQFPAAVELDAAGALAEAQRVLSGVS